MYPLIFQSVCFYDFITNYLFNLQLTYHIRGFPSYFLSSSMYSETETSMMDMPRKTTQKFSINKSVINKGDKGYDEMTHTDGKVSFLKTIYVLTLSMACIGQWVLKSYGQLGTVFDRVQSLGNSWNFSISYFLRSRII